MTTMREKLAAAAFGCSKLVFLNDEETNALDALCAIVEAERDAAIEECAQVFEERAEDYAATALRVSGVGRSTGAWERDMAKGMHNEAENLRSLKKAGGR